MVLNMLDSVPYVHSPEYRSVSSATGLRFWGMMVL